MDTATMTTENINTAQLKKLVEAIEGVEAEIRSLTEDRKADYARAKANGLDPKVIKALIKGRRQDQAELDLFQDQLSAYRRALAE
jgi:uncharacterized protein (UPF0335 family)